MSLKLFTSVRSDAFNLDTETSVFPIDLSEAIPVTTTSWLEKTSEASEITLSDAALVVIDDFLYPI